MGKWVSGWLPVAGWPARVSGYCRLEARENVGPKPPQMTHSVPPGWAEAGSKWEHPAPPGAAKGRVFLVVGGGCFAFPPVSAGGRDLALCKARRGPREATIPRLAPHFQNKNLLVFVAACRPEGRFTLVAAVSCAVCWPSSCGSRRCRAGGGRCVHAGHMIGCLLLRLLWPVRGVQWGSQGASYH